MASALVAAAMADPYKAIPDRDPMPDYLHRGATFTKALTCARDMRKQWRRSRAWTTWASNSQIATGRRWELV